MIESKNNGLEQRITLWRGDIKGYTFTLRLRNTVTNEEYVFANLEDYSPLALTITLSPSFEELPTGEYDYKVENNAGTQILACGLLNYNNKENKLSEYGPETKYNEYTPDGW